jgi:hypothetical protein
LGKGFIDRPEPFVEILEDALFKSNRERKALIEKRNETGEDLEVPERKTLFGRNPFLGRGVISPGFTIPTGAVWQPVVIIYGEYRTAFQTYDNGLSRATEWANRLDLFTNVYLTPTERINIGIRPLDRNNEFVSYRFAGDGGKGWKTPFNGNIRSLFFEGDFGELFPGLDPTDRKSLDYGFAVGRMPLNLQDGIMINDFIDAVGISRSSLFLFGSSATRITGLFGWNDIHRGNNQLDEAAKLYGLFTSLDYTHSTWEFDLAYVDGSSATGGDGLYAGLGQTRRFGKINSTLRANASWALDDKTTAVNTGYLLTSQLSHTLNRNDDVVYLNTFWAIDNYTSAARDPSVGGPLGITGLLYEAVGLGSYQAALSNASNDAVGGSIGYQHFFDPAKQSQIVAEVGGRVATRGESRSGAAFDIRYQRAFGQHTLLRVDGFVAAYEGGDTGQGARLEMSYRF